jgi:NAD(P)-dependent dehydrogenase (short-subunit alcohol dehydrogenase family)
MAQLPNFHIVMACRSVLRCETAKATIRKQHSTTQLTCLPLDLGSRASIEAFPETVQEHLVGKDEERKQEIAPIHVLINNAGQFDSSELQYIDEVETHIQVNHLGHFLLTHCLWKSLSAGKARIVNVSSLAAMSPLNATSGWYPTSSPSWSLPTWMNQWVFYMRSKRANLMFTSELHHRFYNTPSGITSVGSHPGVTQTRMFTEVLESLFVPAGLRQLLHSAGAIGGMPASRGALTQVRAALDPHLASAVYVGPKYWFFGDAVPVGRVTGWTAHHRPFSRDESRLLWDQSLSTLGIGEFGVL